MAPPNSWSAAIISMDDSFASIVLENLINSDPFDYTLRELEFSVPAETRAVTLTFTVTHVCP